MQELRTEEAKRLDKRLIEICLGWYPRHDINHAVNIRNFFLVGFTSEEQFVEAARRLLRERGEVML